MVTEHSDHGEMFSLRDRTVFITGGARGIGLAVARRFTRAGARVAVGDLETGELGDDDRGLLFVEMDVTHETSVASAFDRAAAELGAFDVLVNNAGVVTDMYSLDEVSAEDFDHVFAVNTRGVFLSLKHGVAAMRDRGSIINTSSRSALLPMSRHVPYAASKAAVLTMTRIAAVELGHRGIRVNAICPGYTRTRMGLAYEEGLRMQVAGAPLGRVAELDDVVGAFHFLASDESSFISGQAIVIDGGWTAGPSDQIVDCVTARASAGDAVFEPDPGEPDG